MIYCSVDGSCTFYLLIVIWDSFEAVKVGFVFPLWAINRSLLVHRQHGLSPQWWFNLTTKQKSFKRECLARLILSFQGWTPMRYDHLAIHQDEQVSQLDEVSWAQPDSCRENLKGGLFSVCPFGMPSGVLVWHVIQISLIRDQAVNWKHLKNSAWYFFFFFKCIVNHLIVFKEQLNTLLRLNTPPSQIKKKLLLTAWRTESATGSIEFERDCASILLTQKSGL